MMLQAPISGSWGCQPGCWCILRGSGFGRDGEGCEFESGPSKIAASWGTRGRTGRDSVVVVGDNTAVAGGDESVVALKLGMRFRGM